MIKKQHYLLSLVGAVGLTIILLSFKPKPPRIKYQYITIIAQHHDLDEVNISIDGRDYNKVKLTGESHGHWDLNPVINLVHQYEDEGYELQSVSGNGLSNYFWLRKEK